MDKPSVSADLSIRKMTLRAQITTGCLILLGLSLALAVVLLVIIASQYLHAKRSHEALRLYREVLIAANVISAERGPTNAMLGGDFSPDTEVAQRLMTFRANSDAAVARISLIDPQRADNELRLTKEELAAARLNVDKQLAIPFSQRKLAAMREAIGGMFSAVDAIRPLINVTGLEASGDGQTGDAVIGQQLFEIRDYAGRLGSILTPYIAKRAAITIDDQKRLQQTFGRIGQLWELTRPHLERQPELSGLVADVETVFFNDGIDIVNKLEQEASTGNFSFTTSSMTDAIVPTFKPLEQLRLSYLNLMLDRADDRLRSASRWFLWVAIMAALIVLIDIILVIGTQRMVFGPLLKAREQLILLADEGDLDTDLPVGRGGAEIEEMFTALRILRDKLAERRQMTAHLRLQATTDGLTGLLNRRSFDQIFAEVCHRPGPDQRVGLIIMDIDRFKSINDTYGHAIGDTVLKSVAEIVGRSVRSTDLVARFGGEEFAILVEHASAEVLSRVGESLRKAVAETDIPVEPGRMLNVTASFGIASGSTGRKPDDLFRAADKALYAAKAAGRNRVCLDGCPSEDIREMNG